MARAPTTIENKALINTNRLVSRRNARIPMTLVIVALPLMLVVVAPPMVDPIVIAVGICQRGQDSRRRLRQRTLTEIITRAEGTPIIHIANIDESNAPTI